ncbi:MAG: hypothetical protein ACRDUV_17210 [Pseudonocardiaceae bacterium]
MGQLIAVGALDEQHVRSELTSASSASGYPARDGERAMLATLDSGLASGKGKPRTPWPPRRSRAVRGRDRRHPRPLRRRSRNHGVVAGRGRRA